MRTCKFSKAFLRACMLKKVVPTYMVKRVQIANVSHSPDMERIFLKDEILHEKQQTIENTLHSLPGLYWSKAREYLSLFDIIRLCRYLAELNEQTEQKTKSKHNQLITIFRRKRFGAALSESERKFRTFQTMCCLTQRNSYLDMDSISAYHIKLCVKSNCLLNSSHYWRNYSIIKRALLKRKTL